MAEKIRLSQSSLRSWRRCRLQFHYKYVEKLSPRRIIRPLIFGSAVHRVIEYRIRGKSSEEAFKLLLEERAKIFSAEVDQFDQIMLDARRIMRAYAEYWDEQGDVTYVSVKGRKAEHEFRYDIGQGIELEGIVDAVAETTKSRRWVVEHKSHKKMPDEAVRMKDMQTMLYADAASKELGIKGVNGVMWDYLSSKSPREPTLLKNGTLSKAKIVTLPEVYEEAIKKNNLDKEDYEDVLETLEAQRSQWFKRIFLPLNKGAIETMLEETRITGREIRRKAGVDKTRNISRDCGWCSYEKLCHAELFGMDADFIREREFQVKEPKNEVDREEDPGED